MRSSWSQRMQLFESLYASKTSRCRKLHNITNSVIVLDEAQMPPAKPAAALRAGAGRVGSPLWMHGSALHGHPAVAVTRCSVCTDVRCARSRPEPQALYERLRRTEYRFIGKIEDAVLADRLSSREQVLCVVNSRSQAKSLYDLVQASSDDGDGVLHLSTLMHSVHREKALAEIRLRLVRRRNLQGDRNELDRGRCRCRFSYRVPRACRSGQHGSMCWSMQPRGKVSCLRERRLPVRAGYGVRRSE